MVDQLSRPDVATAIVPVSLRAESVTFAWRGHPVLCGIDLALVSGTITSLRGVNGSGKTTLVRLLAGALEPDGGRVSLGALDAVHDRRAFQRRVGLASAGDRGLYARLDVRANLQLAAGLALLPGDRARELVAASLARFELGELARRRCDQLSLGQRQRLRLAIAFLHEPDVVLLDEPASSLDNDGVGLLARALAELTARGASAMWAAPDGAATLPAQRSFALVDGRLEEAA